MSTISRCADCGEVCPNPEPDCAGCVNHDTDYDNCSNCKEQQRADHDDFVNNHKCNN